jgi:hypothetical protein
MKILFKYATVALLLAGAAACSQPSKRASIIDENIAVAEKQIGMLADSSDLIYLAPWTVTLPGMAILFSVLVTNLVGEGIREALKEGND